MKGLPRVTKSSENGAVDRDRLTMGEIVAGKV